MILDKEVIVAYTVEGKPLNKEQYNKELEAGEKEIEEGNYITHEELIKKPKSGRWKIKNRCR